MRLVALINSVAVSRHFVLSMTIYDRFTETHFRTPELSNKRWKYELCFPKKQFIRDSSFEPTLHARLDGLHLVFMRDGSLVSSSNPCLRQHQEQFFRDSSFEPTLHARLDGHYLSCATAVW